MTTTPRPFPTVGFLERNRRIGTTMTLLLLVGLGLALGAAVGLMLSETVGWMLEAVASAE
ncbi:hypothetical protein LRP67_04300 [Nocardioides sp. cx-169]|uniref:hypothetical protein n=1 Tax=Nocardioides sp. cx-169 TaxID=2899080 RepID=UPI001E42AC72|nr:hypothetical protein [Nocardioides sp. cx-169]MCD4533302.1 hypothetical protein [Nocardioides sp. cx-169]